MVRHYEILTILPGTLSEVDVEPVVAKIKELIESEGAKSLTVEAGGKSRLAYPIKHIRYGYFHVYTFEVAPELIGKIEEKLRLFGQILRTVIKAYDPNKREEKQSMISFLGTEDEKNEKEEIREEKPMKKEEVVAPVAAPVEEEKTAEVSQENPKDVDMKDFDKQLEAILDDKIAGL